MGTGAPVASSRLQKPIPPVNGGTTTPQAPALRKTQGPDGIAGVGYMITTATINKQGMLSATTST
jgi:hypothetical protein